MACLNFASAHGGLPAASTEPTWITVPATMRLAALGWVSSVLPYMEEENISSQYDPSVVWFASANQPLIATRLSAMECPTDPIAGYTINGTNTDRLTASSVSFQAAACDYFAIVAINSNVSTLGSIHARMRPSRPATLDLFVPSAFQDDNITKLADIRDGASQTLMLSEMSGRRGPTSAADSSTRPSRKKPTATTPGPITTNTSSAPTPTTA